MKKPKIYKTLVIFIEVNTDFIPRQTSFVGGEIKHLFGSFLLESCDIFVKKNILLRIYFYI